jgi:hypothetical protein
LATAKKKNGLKAAATKGKMKAPLLKNPPKDLGKKKVKDVPLKHVKRLSGSEIIEKQGKANADKKRDSASIPVNKVKEKYTLSELILLYAVAIDPANKYIVNLAFINLKHPDFFEFITNVLASLKDNDFYPTPSPALDVINEQIEFYYKAKSIGKTQLANEFYANIQYLMKQLAIYVANNCNNLLSTLENSGFIANSLKRSASKDMKQAVISSAKDTKHLGISEATYDDMPGVSFFNGKWCLRDVEDAPMNHVAGSLGVKMDFDELPSKEWVLLFVRAVGPKGPGDWSDGFPHFPR